MFSPFSLQNKLGEEIQQYRKDHQNDKNEQTENSQKAAPDLVDGEVSAKSVQDKKTLQEVLSFFQEDCSFSLEKAALTAEVNEAGDVSSLKAAINKRLADEWSLVVIENARLKTELENIRSRINEEKTTSGEEFATLKVEEESSSAEKTSFTKGEESDRTIGADRLEIIVYEQNEIIAKLEMDKQDFMKRLQRNREDNVADCKSQNASEHCHYLTKDDIATVLREQLNHFVVQKDADLRRGKCGTLEKGCEDCNETKEILKETVENFEVEITKTREQCCDLDQQLIQCTTENSNLKTEVEMLKCELLEARKAVEGLEEHKIAKEETLHQREEIVERELALAKEENVILEKKLQEETEQLEEQRRLLQEKERELTEVKENYKELQRGVNEYKEERDAMVKEFNSLKCLKSLPIVNNTFNNKEEMSLLQNPPLFDSVAKRPPNRKNSRLNSELTRAKEQLVKLKAELTMSNIQTKNLGTQLSSLREDSTKLEAELSTVRVSPKNSRQRRNSFSYYDETVRLEVELGEAKERIIDLQEKLLDIYKEKFALEERILSLESEPKDEACAFQNTVLGAEPCTPAENSLNGGEVQKMNLDHVKLFENKVHLLEAEKAQLKQDLENTNADKNRLEGIEFYLRQLITLDEEQLRLKNKLKILATSDEIHNSEANQETDSSTRRNNLSRIMENEFCIELRELTAENFALQEEAYILKETIVDLQTGLAALKLKLSMKESVHEASRDRRAAASLLVSIRQERAELKNALDIALVEKDDLEEELAQTKMKYNKLQREFAMTSMIKDDLELEIVSLKSKKRGSLDLQQNKEECSDQVLSGAIEDLIFYNDGAVEDYLQEHATGTNDAAITATMGESLVSSTKSRAVRDKNQ